ncbi:MAG: hypothetical protein ABII03_06105 [Nanoarchaeota archaeon]
MKKKVVVLFLVVIVILGIFLVNQLTGRTVVNPTEGEIGVFPGTPTSGDVSPAVAADSCGDGVCEEGEDCEEDCSLSEGTAPEATEDDSSPETITSDEEPSTTEVTSSEEPAEEEPEEESQEDEEGSGVESFGVGHSTCSADYKCVVVFEEGEDSCFSDEDCIKTGGEISSLSPAGEESTVLNFILKMLGLWVKQ